MKKWMISTSVLVCMIALSIAAGEKGDKQKDKGGIAGPMPGDAAPSFTLTDQNGKTVSLNDFSGKIVVLEWFNNECPYVVKFYKEGHMNKLASQYTDKGVVWLAINSTNGKGPAQNKAVASEWKIDRPILTDEGAAIATAYGSKNTPTMYVIDREGKLVYRGAIDNKSDNKTASIEGATNYVGKALDEVLAGKPVSEPMTKAYGCSIKH